MLDKLADINWGLPRAIISDRDRKFVSDLWKRIFEALKTKLLISTAYHPQTDSLSERTNQTAEIALRYFIATLEDPRQWPKLLPRMSSSLNNSTKYSSTNQTPTQVLYSFRIREALDFMRLDVNEDIPEIPAAAFPVVTRRQGQRNVDDIPRGPERNGDIPRDIPVAEDAGDDNEEVPGDRLADMSEYRPSHIDAKDAIAFAAMRIKDYYDARHLPKFFSVGDYVNLRLHRSYKVPGVLSKKLGPQLVGPFKVVERIGKLAYKLELPATMRIHNVISIAHLEPGTVPEEDPYHRRYPPPPPVIIEGEEEYEIEKIVARRAVRRGRNRSLVTEYLIRWKNCGPEEDTWQAEWTVADTKALDNYERLYGAEVALTANACL